MKQAIRRVTWIGVAVALLVLAGCGGGPNLAQPAVPRLEQPQILSFSAKVVSGAPAGLYITWTRVDSPFTKGYYLYRDTAPIPVWDPASPPAGLRTNGGSLILQPADSGPVTFNDLFEIEFGQIYYYRVTVVNLADDESDPSDEESFTVANFTVDTVTPDQAFWGDEVVIGGTQFGDSLGTLDSVQFPQVGGGEIEANVVLWTDTAITVEVPELAVTGELNVIVSSVLAQSPVLTILQPTIFGLSPAPGFLEQQLAIQGVNFGAAQGTSTIDIGTVAISAGDIVSWGDGEIVVNVPATVDTGDVIVTVDGRASNAVEFIVRPEIQSLAPVSAQLDEQVILSGRRFGTGVGRLLLDGTTELAVAEWTENSLTFTVTGSEAVHQLTVERADGELSNEQPFQIVPPLDIAFSGLTAGQLFRSGDIATLVVNTAADAARVELLIDGAVAGDSTTAPFDDLPFDLATLVNGNHTVQLRAHRRAVSVDSPSVAFKVYTLVGDVNGDGAVDDLDRETLAGLLGLTPADAGYEVWIDTNEDGEVTELDVAWIGYNFGNTLP